MKSNSAYLLTTIACITVLSVPSVALAETSVTISGNGAGSSSSVSVESNSSSSVQSSSTSQNRTDIRIETNGDVKEYHSTSPEQDVVLRSDDGSSQVHISTNQDTGSRNISSQAATEEQLKKLQNDTKKKLDEANKNVVKVQKKTEEQRFSFMDFITQQLNVLKRFFHM